MTPHIQTTNNSLPDRPMSDDFHRAAEELINAALVRDADPHRHRVAVKWMEAEEKADRLSRALAKAEPPTHKDAYGRLLHECPVYCLFRAWFFEEEIDHAPDCGYVEAVEHVAALEDQC